MPGVVASLVAGDDPGLVSQVVDDVFFAFVFLLRADDDQYGYGNLLCVEYGSQKSGVRSQDDSRPAARPASRKRSAEQRAISGILYHRGQPGPRAGRRSSPAAP